MARAESSYRAPEANVVSAEDLLLGERCRNRYTNSQNLGKLDTKEHKRPGCGASLRHCRCLRLLRVPVAVGVPRLLRPLFSPMRTRLRSAVQFSSARALVASEWNSAMLPSWRDDGLDDELERELCPRRLH